MIKGVRTISSKFRHRVKGIIVNIIEAVEAAWSKTVHDFEKAKENGEAWVWTEATLRLVFFHQFCEQGLDIQSMLAETAFHLGDTDYKPDIMIEILADSEIKTVVFELKYFNRKWFNDWEKLRLYGIIGWDYGYFLGIGFKSQCEKIPKFEKQEFLKGAHICELRGLVHPTPRLKYAPMLKIAEGLLKNSLPDAPYLASNFVGAVALFKDFDVYFDVVDKEKKCVVWVKFSNKIRDESKLEKLGLDEWISIDKEGKIVSSKDFVGKIFLGEFEPTTYKENKNKVKRVINEFMEKMEELSRSSV